MEDIRRQLAEIGPVGSNYDADHGGEEDTEGVAHISYMEAVVRMRALAGGLSIALRNRLHAGQPIASGRQRDGAEADDLR